MRSLLRAIWRALNASWWSHEQPVVQARREDYELCGTVARRRIAELETRSQDYRTPLAKNRRTS